MTRLLATLAIALSFSGTLFARGVYVPPVRTKVSLLDVLSNERARQESPRKIRPRMVSKDGRAVYNSLGAIMVGDEATYTLFIDPMPPQTPPQGYKLGTCSLLGTSLPVLVTDSCSTADITTVGCSYSIKITAVASQQKNITMSCDLYTHLSTDPPGYWGYAGSKDSFIDWKEFEPKPPPKCKACEKGSDISVDGQTVAEQIPIVGTDFEMVYSSEYAYDRLSRERITRIPSFRPNGLSVSVHHAYDSVKKILYFGDGHSQAADFVLVSGNHRVVSPQGDEVFIFSTGGKHLQTKFGLTGATKYTFAYETSDDQLKTITDSYGNVTNFWKDSFGNLSSIQAPRGQTSTVTLNPSTLLVTAISNPASQVYSLSYHTGKDLLYTFTKPGGQVTTFYYDEFGRMIQDLGNGGNSWTFTSDPLLSVQPIQKVSTLGRTTDYSIELVGTNYVRYQTEPYGFQTFTEERPNGELNIVNSITSTNNTRVNDNRLGPNVQRISYETLTKDSVSSATSYSQTLSGFTNLFSFTSMTRQKTTSGRTDTSVYTSATNTFVNTTHEGATTTKIINTSEQPTSFKIGNDTPTTYTYDSYGRISVVDQGGYNTLTYTYNSNGYVQKITNARSEDTLFTYDNAGRALTTTLPDLRVITYTYDSNGKLLTVTPPSRPVHTFTFNTKELMDTYTPPTLSGVSPIATSYTYNNDKQLTSVTRPDGKSLTYSYNSTTGLLDSITFSAGVGNYFTYIANSPLISKIDSRDGITSQYTYYGDQLRTEEQSNTSSTFLYSKVTYNYDTDHRQTSRVFRGNAATPATTISTTYNNDSKPTQIGNLVLTYSYPSGRVSTTTLDNISDSRTYDARGNLSSYTATYTPTSTVLYSYTLTRDAMSRISGKTETIQGVTDTYVYTYDVAGRLTAVTKNGSAYSSYVYDNNGNRTSGSHAGTSFTATYNDQDWMLTYNSVAYTYNNNGDLTNIQYTGTNSKALVFDPFGNLKSVTIQPGGTVYNYHLDGKHQRVARIAAGSVVERYHYENPYQIIGQVGGAGVIQKQYVYATNINSPDYMINSSNVRFRFIKDHLGSPRLVVNSNNGTVAQRLDYTDLGKVTNNTAPTVQPFGFAGGLYDSNTGFTHFGARDYDPETGRWLQKDPIRFAGGDSNLYGYVLSNPINFIDPSGLDMTHLDLNPFGRMGPRNGNWGGGDWSGGQAPSQNGGEDGSAPPMDSADSCYRDHDMCYSSCGKQDNIKSCDAALKQCLGNLPSNMKDWPMPPRSGTEASTNAFKEGAMSWF